MSAARSNPHTAPASLAIVDYLQKHGPTELKVIVADCGWSWNYSVALIARMHKAGLVHIHAWRSASLGGYPAKVWAAGAGEDAKQPKPKSRTATQRDHWKRKRDRLTREYGKEIAKKVLRSANQGGAMAVYVDGKQVFRRYTSPSCNVKYRGE